MKYARAWHALTFAVAAGAVILQLVLVVQGHQHFGDSEPAIEAVGTPGLGTRLSRFVSYLTIWSNVLGAAIAFTLVLDPQRDGKIWRALRLDAVVILFGGGLVHWFFLRPLLDLSGADLVADRLLHIVVPILVVIGWIAFGPRNRITTGDLGRFLIVPLAWFVYTLIRGAFVDWYPYPFVDVTEHGYPTVVLTALAIGAVLAVLALLCRLSDRYLR
jgi:hypothetical protein